jgi:hypothetical protein
MDRGEDCRVLLWRAKEMTVVEGRVTAVAIRVPVSAHYLDIANESVLYLAFGASTNASSAANATSPHRNLPQAAQAHLGSPPDLYGNQSTRPSISV